MKYLLYTVFGISLLFLYLRSDRYQKNSELPVFLRHDPIAENHSTRINISVESMITPDTLQLELFRWNYGNLWAHLNNSFETNDVVSGKEYYTENWYNQICQGDNSVLKTKLKRTDLSHNVHIINWSPDNLACSIIDSNAVFRHEWSNRKIFERTHHIAMVLLYEGDHWRIDSIKYLNLQ